MTNTFKKLVLCLGLLPVISCGPPAGGQGSTGAGVSGACQSDFGDGSAARKLEAFLGATADFHASAGALHEELYSACKDMGKDLGMPDAQLGGDMQQTCNAVSNHLRAEFGALRGEANLRISVAAQPPRCEVSVDAYARCQAECDVEYEPGKVDVQCEGGEIVGECSAECKGSCVVEASGKCEGQCEGTCGAGCSGTCNGTCEGKCSQKNAQGECVGKCEGTCHGTCSAGCKGECSGTCEVKGQASCQGECHGGCSVEYEEPRCTGEVKAPSANAECDAYCDSKLEAKAECEPGRAEVVIEGDVGANSERVERLRNALRSHWGRFISVGARLERVARAGGDLVKYGKDVPGAVGDLTAGAAICATQAASAAANAMASVSMSVDVSVSVSASASASAG